MTVNEIFNLDIAIYTKIEELEPNLSKAYADLASALYHKSDEAKRQISNNQQVYSGLINREVACMCSVLCRYGKLACCNNDAYKDARMLLMRDTNGDIGVLKYSERLIKLVGVEPQVKISFEKLRKLLSLYGLVETSEDEIQDGDIIDPSDSEGDLYGFFDDFEGEGEEKDGEDEEDEDLYGEMAPELTSGSPQGENGLVGELEGEDVWGVREDPEAPQRVSEISGNNDEDGGRVKTGNPENDGIDDTGYNDSIHRHYYKVIADLLLETWGDLYGKYVNGQEIVNGLLMPYKAFNDEEFTAEQETAGVITSGLLQLDKGMNIRPDIFSRAIYQEYIAACKECGIKVVNRVGLDINDIKEYKYNPILQKAIISGSIDREAFRQGWKEYGNSLIKKFDKKIKALAVQKAETGADDEIYNQLSGYLTSLMYINYKDGLGTQLRVCCGDISRSKTEAVARRLRQKLIARENSNRSIAQGKMIVSAPSISSSGRTFLMDIYINIDGYQAVPQFMGELLYNMQEGSFKPSVNNMLIGTTLDNNLMTAPLSSGWLVPILAGSRSGKGVLTLNMLLNVIGTGTPLYYFDGKPDMASMLWNLCKANGINKSVIIDGIGYKGITDVDKAPYEAPYYNEVQAALRSSTANKVIVNNLGFMIYIKAMLVLILSVRYYTDFMDRQYGNVFVVIDEVFKVITKQGQQFIRDANAEIDRLKKSKPNTEGMSKEEKAEANKKIRELADAQTEVNKVINFVNGVLGDMVGNDIGVFGNGIKAVALSQPTMVQDYKVEGFTGASEFATSMLLKRGPKLFGRQKSYSGMYGLTKGTDDVKFDLMDKYFYFGQGDSSGSTTDGVQVFKPLLVLNECDAKEITGNNTDGAFVDTMMQRIKRNVNPDEFRQKYFVDNPALGRTIGFEGALEQVGRLTGQDWKECFRQSIERAYDISDAALRHFNVIGPESGTGLNSLYEYLVSCETSHLWSYGEIRSAKDAGKKLAGSSEDMKMSNTDEDDYKFGGNPFANIGSEPNEKTNSDRPQFVLDDEDEGNDPLINKVDSEESGWKPIKRNDSEAETVDTAGFEHVGGNNDDPWDMEEYPEFDDSEDEQWDKRDIREQEDLSRNIQKELNAKFDESPYNTEQSYSVKGNYTFITSNAKAMRMGLNRNNAVILDVYANSAIGANNRLLNTIRGADFELRNRWKQILAQVARAQNPATITRVTITNDLVMFNKMMIACYGLLGGQEGVEVSDIVRFDMLAKKFRNIRKLTIDREVYDTAYTEFGGDPERGIFSILTALRELEITGSRGSETVTTRQQLDSREVSERAARAKLARGIDAVADMSNPDIKKSSNMKKYRMQKKYSGFQGKLNNAVTKNLGKGTAGGLAIGSIAAIGAISFAALGYGFRKLRGIFG